jgi:hypothetical protein
MTAAISKLPTAMVSVFDDRQRCLGFVLSRGRDGYEAFDASDRPIGMFGTTDAAAAALWRVTHHQTEVAK